MLLLVKAATALVVAHVLPGTLVVRSLHLGRNRIERMVVAAVLGGPIAAAIYFIALVSPWPDSYWVLLGLIDCLAVVCLLRARKPSEASSLGSPGSLAWLLLVILLVEGAYLTTTAGLSRLDREGNFVMDPAFQADALFHVGLARSLEVSYPPELLSQSGVRMLYHVGYDLQVAAWSRFFGVDPFDGFHRVAPLWYLPLLVLSAYLFGLRFGKNPGVAVLSAALLFATGLGFLFHSAPKANWWSLVFMDATLVSVFLVNPLLPALSLFFVGMTCLDDYLEGGGRGTLAGAAGALSFLFTLKIFLAAQTLLALVLATVLTGRRPGRRLARATLTVLLASTPFLLGMLLQAQDSNTSVGLRPLEIVRYSMELLGWDGWASRLALIGAGNVSPANLAVALAATAVWLVGFLGLRLLGFPRIVRDAASPTRPIRRPLALFALVSFPLTLLFRVAPSEAVGLSRSEALNDALWFATQGGVLFWFWTAEGLAAFAARARGGTILAAILAAPVAFAGTVQHFTHKASLEPDVVPAAFVEASLKGRDLSAPTDVFVEPLNRMRPSLSAYLAGRPVVYDSYPAWDYMFVSRKHRELRHHAVAQFWKTAEPGYAAWFLNRFDVRWVVVPKEAKAPAAAGRWMERVFSNEAAALYRVQASVPPPLDIEVPSRIPLGVPGHAFLGQGWSQPIGSPRNRRLRPGTAYLFLPFDGGESLSLTLDLMVPHASGRLVFLGQSIDVSAEQSQVTLLVPPQTARPGLNRLELAWEADAPIRVTSITLAEGSPNETD